MGYVEYEVDFDCEVDEVDDGWIESTNWPRVLWWEEDILTRIQMKEIAGALEDAGDDPRNYFFSVMEDQKIYVIRVGRARASTST